MAAGSKFNLETRNKINKKLGRLIEQTPINLIGD